MCCMRSSEEAVMVFDAAMEVVSWMEERIRS